MREERKKVRIGEGEENYSVERINERGGDKEMRKKGDRDEIERERRERETKRKRHKSELER